jgi:hypothetical protein
MMLAFVGTALVALVACGCSGGGAKGDVSGKVTYDGKEVPSGSVSFRNKAGWTGNSNIKEGGTYEITGVPAGQVEVTVQTFPPSPGVVRPDAAPNSVKIASQKYVELPKAYADFKTSGVTLDVQAGKQTKDLDLAKK